MDDAFLVTTAMVDAGVMEYANPGRYDSYEDTVVKIFCAMMSAKLGQKSAPGFAPMDGPELGGGKADSVDVGHRLDGPRNEALLNGPDLDE